MTDSDARDAVLDALLADRATTDTASVSPETSVLDDDVADAIAALVDDAQNGRTAD